MKLIKTLTASSLLTLGGLFLLAAAYMPFEHEIDREQKISEAAACLLFGLPLTGVGGLIAWGLSQQAHQEKRDRLQSIFYKLLKKSNGRITLLQFAMEAKLTGSAARYYLDEQAREFNANFEVSDRGDVFYSFNIGQPDSPKLALVDDSTFSGSPKQKKGKHKRKKH